MWLGFLGPFPHEGVGSKWQLLEAFAEARRWRGVEVAWASRRHSEWVAMTYCGLVERDAIKQANHFGRHPDFETQMVGLCHRTHPDKRQVKPRFDQLRFGQLRLGSEICTWYGLFLLQGPCQSSPLWSTAPCAKTVRDQIRCVMVVLWLAGDPIR